MSDLKDCLFCGAKADSINYQEGYIAHCRLCYSETAIYPTLEEAEEAWNKGEIKAAKENLDKINKVK